MARKRKFGADDLASWRSVKSTVKPLSTPKVKSRAVHPMEDWLEDEAKAARKAEAAASPPLSGSYRPHPLSRTHSSTIKVHYQAALPSQDIEGLHRSQRRAIRKGQLDPSARIDLHGLRLERARSQFGSFLHQSARQGHKVVLVITGKGGHKRLGDFGQEISGVIRRAFPEWMNEREIASLVSHYTPAHIKHGGEGAWYVFIRADARRKLSSK